MYPIRNGIIQHEIINGNNNCDKNDKSCCEFHKISPYKYIVLSIQKGINSETKNVAPRGEQCSNVPRWWTRNEAKNVGGEP